MTGVDLTGVLDRVSDAVDRAIEATEEQWESWRVSASSLGEDCERKTWYRFRCAFHPQPFDGRMLRLFRTGQRQEAQIIDDLRAAGIDVQEVDPATGKQFKFYAVEGHLTCKPDGLATNVPGAEQTRHALEVKTHHAKSFAQLKKHGVEAAQPKHVAQMEMEMALGGVDRALYVALNKDDETLYTERLEANPERAARLLAKAERIVEAHEPSPKVSDNLEKPPCRFCPAKAICQEGEFARRNCRTCAHSSPIPGGKWQCEKFGHELSADAQKAGCPHHRYLPVFVPGEVTDVDEADETVVYQLAEGGAWEDRGMAS